MDTGTIYHCGCLGFCIKRLFYFIKKVDLQINRFEGLRAFEGIAEKLTPEVVGNCSGDRNVSYFLPKF